MKYNPYEIGAALDDMVILADTREQDTAAFRKRFAACNVRVSREKLDFGDYSALAAIGNDVISLKDKVAVERKMSLDELAMCFGKERGRFEREFQRAAAANAKIYLLVEGATWENVLNGKYRSKLSAKAFTASMAAWTARYNLVPIFCKAETSGTMIALIMRYEMRQYLEGVE